ncbi:hypothetical protein TSAR_003967 [Trichomalopsis sarcophagae]|uniref:Uncharacterized protein n=1 Tax=Trichomalopsis sarcophagae TaxID=543379 RepID=A0A232F6B2_9HYME|nr:hypothetical protein TSAR_003967 [Trichomalopsis sarcophagae]
MRVIVNTAPTLFQTVNMCDFSILDRSERIKRYKDRKLHKILVNLVRKQRHRGSEIRKRIRSSKKHTLKLEMLEQEPAVSKLLRSRNNQSLLWVAVLNSYYDSAEVLVRLGANVNELLGSCDSQLADKKSTVLHVLLQRDPCARNDRLIHIVLDHGADLRARDSEGRTVLHVAVMKDRGELTEMLLKRGADLRARDYRGQTALHFAVTNDRVGMIEMLLENGADIEAADDKGVTPVLDAAVHENADVLIPLLMKHEANILVKDADGENVLHRLSRASVEHTVLARFFIEKGVISLEDRDSHYHRQPIHTAAMAGNNELVKLYIEHGANVNARMKYGYFPLYLAAVNGKPAVVRTLLERGADIHQRTVYGGRSALHNASENSIIVPEHYQDENIRLLLSAGADVLIEDDRGKTPFALINRYEYASNPGTSLIIQELALKKVCQPEIEIKDERIIEQHSELQNYYQECIEQVERMKVTKFIKTCTFLDLLTKCACQIANLMRNPEFEVNFENYDLTEFPAYATNLYERFKLARRHYDSMLDQEDLLNDSFYGILPYFLVRKMVHYILNDCCRKKNLLLNSKAAQMFKNGRHYDPVLCQSLEEIFRERRFTPSEIKEFVSAPDNNYRNFMINLILKHNKYIIKSKHISRKELRNLSLLWIAVLDSTCYLLIELLVRSGADVNQLYGLDQKVHYQIDLNEKSTILHALVQMNPNAKNERLVRLVLDHGADLEARDDNDRTALEFAVKYNRPRIFRILLKRGADFYARDSLGQTILYTAVEKGRIMMTKRLLEIGAKLQIRNKRGQIPLHLAVKNGHFRIIKILLEKGADINAADNEGTTPLLEAARSIGNINKLLMMLIQNGADASARNYLGRNILHCLTQVKKLRHDADLVKILIERGASLEDVERVCRFQPLHMAVFKENYKLTRIFLDHGANVDAVAIDGLYPLYLATACAEKRTMAEILIKHGANANQMTIFRQQTVLHLACRVFKNDERIKILLLAGADVLAVDRYGRTPFGYIKAKNLKKPESFSIIKELALIKATQPSITLKDKKKIERHPDTRDHYRDCHKQIERMKVREFYNNCTFFQLLTKCHCQIAKFMRNPEFEISFNRSDFSEISHYTGDLRVSFERAKKHYHYVLEQENLIDDAVCNNLPYLVIRLIVHYICNCCKNAK